jgi:hypothetical protein
MRLFSKFLFLCTIALIFITIAFDKIIFQKYFPFLNQPLGVALDIKFWAGGLYLPRFAVLPIILVTLIFNIILLLPYASFRDKSAWLSFLRRVQSIILHSFWMPVLLMLGTLIHKITIGYYPEWLKKLSEAITISAKLFTFDYKFATLDFGLAGILGLLIGIIFWYNFGFSKK